MTENNINFDNEDWWKYLDIYYKDFLSFGFDHFAFDEDKFKKLVEKWKLNT